MDEILEKTEQVSTSGTPCKRRTNSATPEKTKKRRGESCFKEKHRKQSYKTEWERMPEFSNWLGAVKGNNLKAQCKVCNMEFTAELTVIKNHSKSLKHKKSNRSIGLNSGQRTIFECVQNSDRNTAEIKVKEAELRTCAFLAEHNIALCAVEHLILRDKACYPDSKTVQNIHLGRTKATNIIKNVIGQSHFETLARYLCTKKFSIIVDESTDIAAVKSLCICVRYFCNTEQRIVTRFWNLVQIFSGDNAEEANEGATANRIFDAINQSFMKANVPLTNIIGFASDGCNVMFGSNNSVAKKFEDSLPGITLQKCICHSLHLVASEACKKIPRHVEDLARDIHAFFKNSSKRIAQLQEFQEFCEAKVHKILRPSQTRWLSLLEVVKRLLEQWQPLRLYFDGIHYQTNVGREDPRLKSVDHIFSAMHDPQTKIYLIFLEWILPKIVGLNELFQSDKTLITIVHNKMVLAYKDLLCIYVNQSYVLNNNVAEIDPDPKNNTSSVPFLPLDNIYLGVKIMQELSKPEIASRTSMVKDIRERCLEFIVTACLELKKRFDFKDTSPLAKMSCLGYDIATSSSPTRPATLMPLMLSLPRIIDPVNSQLQQKVDDQWRKLPLLQLPDSLKDTEPDKLWARISSLRDIDNDNGLEDLTEFALNVLSLPHSSAACERIFSKTNNVKTKTRNKLIAPTVNGLLLTSQCVQINGGCHKFNVTDDMLSRFNTINVYNKKNIDDDDIVIQINP